MPLNFSEVMNENGEWCLSLDIDEPETDRRHLLLQNKDGVTVTFKKTGNQCHLNYITRPFKN
jgi:hypothetical protein